MIRSTSFIRPVLGSMARSRMRLRPSGRASIPGYRVGLGMIISCRSHGSAMARDTSVEFGDKEQPSAPPAPGRLKPPRGDEVADRGGRFVAEIVGRLGGREVWRVGAHRGAS